MNSTVQDVVSRLTDRVPSPLCERGDYTWSFTVPLGVVHEPHKKSRVQLWSVSWGLTGRVRSKRRLVHNVRSNRPTLDSSSRNPAERSVPFRIHVTRWTQGRLPTRVVGSRPYFSRTKQVSWSTPVSLSSPGKRFEHEGTETSSEFPVKAGVENMRERVSELGTFVLLLYDSTLQGGRRSPSTHPRVQTLRSPVSPHGHFSVYEYSLGCPTWNLQ